MKAPYIEPYYRSVIDPPLKIPLKETPKVIQVTIKTPILNPHNTHYGNPSIAYSNY